MTLAVSAWRRALVACGVFTLALIGLFWPTVDTMVTTWANADTYSHGFVILPISLWLAWRRRDKLLAVVPGPAPWVLMLCLTAGAGWVLANLLGIQVIAQLAFVGLWVSGLWALLGHRVARLLAFPLLFLFLMVPMGDSLVPPMMDFTADFTVWMLELTGIPVYREGLDFVIPSGNWSVVEACSGVRYLIASVTLGLLYAYLTYRSLWRRAVFVVLAALAPILANGLRAYMIVMIGHLSDMQLAVGVDHLIYGWVFFGLVMLLLFWLGGLWAEDAADVASGATQPRAAPPATGLGVLAGVLVAGLTIAATMRVGVAGLSGIAAGDVLVELPQNVAGWERQPAVTVQWPVHLPDADQTLSASYIKQDAEVTLVLGVFHRQRQGAEVISSNNAVLDRDADGWRVAGRGWVTLGLDGDDVTVPVYRLSKTQRFLLGDATERVLVANWYRLGSYATSNDYLGKWYQALALLGDGRADGAFMMLAVRDTGDAPRALSEFAKEALPAVLAELDAARVR